jgi:hypothetical protein
MLWAHVRAGRATRNSSKKHSFLIILFDCYYPFTNNFAKIDKILEDNEKKNGFFSHKKKKPAHRPPLP